MQDITFSSEAKAPQQLDHLPLIAGYAHELELVDIINQHCPPHPCQKVNHGECVLALVLSILHGNYALYQLEDWMKQLSVETLFGRSIESKHFNDTRLAETLDALHKVGLKPIFSSLVSKAIEKHHIKTDRLHGDTTSIKVYGDYKNVSKDSLQLLHGYSKDKRPDLKQLIFGLVVSRDGGIPVLGDLHNGNQSDHITNRFHIQQLQELVPHIEDTTLIYDSKFCDAKTIGLAHKKKLDWLTLVPQTHSIREKLIKRYQESDSDGSVLMKKIDKNKEIQLYKGVSIEGKMEVLAWDKSDEKKTIEVPVRYLVVHSSQLEEQHQRSLQKKIAKENNLLAKSIKEMSKKRFACAEDACKAQESWLKNLPLAYHSITLSISKADSKYALILEMNCPEKQVAWHQKKQGCFVLATSHLTGVSDKELLEWYKEQHQVEQGFHWLKGIVSFAPIFLKKPERILAMGLLFLLALMVYTLIERQIRKSLLLNKQTIQGNNKVKTDKPTASAIFRHFKGISLVWISIEGVWKPVVPALNKLQLEVLNLLNLPPEVFIHKRLRRFGS